MWWWRDQWCTPEGTPRIQLGFTDRHGGAGSGERGTLNLGTHVGDDPAVVAANRESVRLAFGSDHVVYLNQVHGTQVALIEGPSAQPPTADAAVTSVPGLALAVMVADCTPVLLADVDAGVVGVAHAGRPGMIDGVIPAVVDAMRGAGARTIQASIGPSICGRCYEVPVAMRDAAARVAGSSQAITWRGTPAIDVAAGVAEQLAREGVTITSWVPGCTRESPELFSHRRTPEAGRCAGLIAVQR